jgi:hypothetical protein
MTAAQTQHTERAGLKAEGWRQLGVESFLNSYGKPFRWIDVAYTRKVTKIQEKIVKSEPGADRGPRAGSPRGVVDATGSYFDDLESLLSYGPVATATDSDFKSA